MKFLGLCRLLLPFKCWLVFGSLLAENIWPPGAEETTWSVGCDLDDFSKMSMMTQLNVVGSSWILSRIPSSSIQSPAAECMLISTCPAVTHRDLEDMKKRWSMKLILAYQSQKNSWCGGTSKFQDLHAIGKWLRLASVKAMCFISLSNLQLHVMLPEQLNILGECEIWWR